MTFVWALAALQAQYFIQMSAVLCYNDLNYPGILKEFVQKDIDLEVWGNHFSWNNVGGEGGGGDYRKYFSKPDWKGAIKKHMDVSPWRPVLLSWRRLLSII